jgi:LysR family nitrogen assimilation transcriptional regulator
MDGLQNVISVALRASAYTILSHAAVAKEVSSGELMLVPVINPKMTHTAYIIRKRGRPISRASIVIENLLFAILKEMATKQRLRVRLLKA